MTVLDSCIFKVRRYTAAGQHGKKFRMPNEAAVEPEEEGRLATRPGAFERWITVVPPNAVLGLLGAFLVAAASGFFLMLDAQFEAQREWMKSRFEAERGWTKSRFKAERDWMEPRFEAERDWMSSEFKALHGRFDTLEKKLDDSLGKIDRRLLRIEEHLFGGAGSDVKRE